MKEKTKPEDPIEAKHAIAEVFNRLGGVAGMTVWAKNHRQSFYQLYTKLIPLQVGGHVTAKVEGDAKAALEQILTGILATRQEEADDGVIDVAPTAPVLEPLVVTKAPPPAPPTLSVAARDSSK